MIKSTGHHTVLTEEVEEDIQIWIITMKKSGVPVKWGMLLIKVNQIYLEAFGMNTRSRQVLSHEQIQIFMAIHSLLTMSSSNIIKRIIAKYYFDCIKYVYHKATKHIIERCIQTKCIYNKDETVSGQKSRNKRVISVKALRNM